MTWNYRIIKRSYPDWDDEEYHAIHEVYYDEKGEIQAWTIEPVALTGYGMEDLEGARELYLQAFDRPILDFKDLEDSLDTDG